MFGEHSGAGAGGGDDVIIAGEGGDDTDGEIAGGFAVAGVVGGLAAAGLGARDLDDAAGGFQQGDAGETDGRAVQVHQASDEEGDSRQFEQRHDTGIDCAERHLAAISFGRDVKVHQNSEPGRVHIDGIGQVEDGQRGCNAARLLLKAKQIVERKRAVQLKDDGALARSVFRDNGQWFVSHD